LGIAFDIAVEELVARMPTLQETMTLRLVPGTPVVELIRTIYAKDENLIECLSSSSRPTVSFTYVVPMD
jgi:DNA-binding GntR family transcriptional regulator